jgi:uncharacterized protein YijF (DUF1287 family)
MTSLDRRSVLLGAGASLALAGCGEALPSESQPAPAPGKADRLIAAARAQIGITIRYDAGYSAIPFPDGDVPRARGSCTDVLIRAYRDALGADLQALVNADMHAHFAAYPRTWGLTRPDPNIDHRRAPNLATFLRRMGASLPVPPDAAGWRPGDIFTSNVDNRGPHIGLVSDRTGPNGWLVLQNVGNGTHEEEGLFAWPITGRYRWGLA